MYRNEKILAFIPARGGSKGIPDKNIYPVKGKPLISYTIEAARNSRLIDDILVSTDSERIASVAREYGADVPFMRPDELAGDRANIIDAVLYTIERLRTNGQHYDTLVLLQPTQLLRTSDEIDEAIEVYYKNEKRGVASVSEVDDHPILIRTIDDKGILKRLLDQGSTVRRQDMPPYYRINGCIYINDIGSLVPDTSFNDNPVPYIMSRDHSVDIDEMRDIQWAEFLLS